jgi:L-iditol 2-dehydrogenase
MKAVRIKDRTSVELRDVTIPHIGNYELLVRMRACGICGTDIEKMHGEHITPPVLGHEVAGEIEEIGAQMKEFKKGDRIIVHHHVSCASCFYCKNGLETLCEAYRKSNLDPCGFSEFFRVPETLVRGGTVYRLPNSLSFEEGSQVEPTACCIRALRKSGIKPGSNVAVFGVGPAGLTHIQLLKLGGVAQIFAIDIIEGRRRMAARFGATATLNPTNENVAKVILDGTEGQGVDHAIVATGNTKAIEEAFVSVRKGGHVILFGAPARGAFMSLDVSSLFLREITLQSSYSTSETEMQIALDLIAQKRIAPAQMITHRIPLQHIDEAFHLAADGREAVKVVVTCLDAAEM